MEIAALYDGQNIFGKNDFTENKIHLEQIILTSHLASQIDSVDPMEKAISKTHKEVLINNAEHTLIKEYALSRELLAMTRVTEDAQKNINISAKGAPETIIKLCGLSEPETAKHLDAVKQMAEQGYRVIGVAAGSGADKSLPESQTGFKFNFLGFIGLEDPIRSEIPGAIKECYDAGIKVIMITGDFPATAKSIANQIGLDADKETMTGEELKKLSDDELRKRILHVNIFARVVPEQKLRIVEALKANNEIVAMTGDGVNDAPALKASNIGIAMGNKGTDVAREASSLVLLDDNFASIVSAIRSGRRIFDNLQKAMSYIIAIHIPIIGLTLLPAFITSLPLLLMPLHIVFMELIIDPVCSIVFESEQEEKGIMKRMPRKPDEQFFGGKKILSSALQGLLLLAMVIIIYFLSLNEGHTDGEVRAITFCSLIIGNIFLILSNLSKTRSFVDVLLEKNLAVLLIVPAALSMLLLIISVPSLQQIFSFEFPGYQHFIPSIIGAGSLVLILEIIKYIRYRKSLKQITL